MPASAASLGLSFPLGWAWGPVTPWAEGSPTPQLLGACTCCMRGSRSTEGLTLPPRPSSGLAWKVAWAGAAECWREGRACARAYLCIQVCS